MHALPMLLDGARLIGWALLHFLWQGTLLGLVYVAIRAALPRGEARYCFGMGMLVALSLCPLLTAWRLLQTAVPATRAGTDMMLAGVLVGGTEPHGGWGWDAALDLALPWLALVWSAGVLVLSLRAWRQWRGLKALVRMAGSMPQWQERVNAMAAHFGLRRRVTVLCSKVIATPALVGWIRPVILLPLAVACHFPMAQIELILAHELAHLRRWDPLANLFQVVLETLYFYHPVVRWVSRDVRNEREICCDRLALSVSGGSRHAFVAALAELGELRERHSSLLLAANGGVLLDRVQQMVVPAHGAARLRTSARFVAVMVGAMMMVLTLRLEWKQARLQRNLTTSLLQLQSVLVPPWLPLRASMAMWRMPNLVLAHAEAARPLPLEPTVGLSRTEATPMQALALSLSSPSLPVMRISDLAVVRGATPPQTALPARAEIAPTPIRIRQPVYPEGALVRGIEGQVVVEFNLAEDGSVGNLRVVSATPAGVFDQAAIQAMRGWKYAVPAGAVPRHPYRQTLAFTFNASTSRGASAPVGTRGKINARVGCQIVTGTHICRWPGDMRPHTGMVERY